MPKLKVLHIMRCLDVGGIGMFVMNTMRQMDSNEVQFDFAIAYDSFGDFGQEITDRGGKIHFLSKNGNRGICDAVKQLVNLSRLLKKEKYDVVHCHYYFANAIFLLVARINHIKRRVSHCHNTRTRNVSSVKKIVESILRKILLSVGTDFLGCSTEAVKFLYGDKELESGTAKVLYNGIDYKIWDRNNFNKEFLKEKYNVNEGCKVLVFVGRFEEQKNPLYALEVSRRIFEKGQKTKLFMVGYGSYQDEIEQFIASNNMADYVELLPRNTIVSEVQAISDVMIAHSYWGGLSIAFIEAKKMRTMVFTSTMIPDEVDIGYCRFLDLSEKENWVNEICKYLSENEFEREYNERFLLFDASRTAKELYLIYTGKSNN